MTTPEYMHLADECLGRVTRWLEEFDPDEVDYSTTDGMVSIEFPDRQRFVLNRQSGNHQMWFAAGVSAWHFAWDPERRGWFDDKDGHELYGRVAGEVSRKLGRPVAFES
ncbi:MAG TPA: iron donor protein CyaY [Candidatus Binatia bacterium]|nr:iron donor protein CyaY [Candidatus Binatia bacterium]